MHTPSIRRTRCAAPTLLIVAAPFFASPLASQESTLHVEGTGEVRVAPDRARLSFAVETEARTAREAAEANAVAMEGVVEALRGTDVEGLTVETAGYHLQPQYRQGTDRVREITGYLARNTVVVVADDVDVVGLLIDTALEAGANRVAGLSFEVRDPDPHRREALGLAVEQARAEAEAISAALGMRLGSPTQVQGSADRPRFPMMAAARAEGMAADVPTTPVEAGEQTISASVSVTYRLLPN